MLRTRLYLGLLPLLLLFIAVGLLAIWLSRDLGRAVDRDLNAHYEALIAGYEMRDAARRLNQAIRDADRGDPLAAREAFNAQRARFERHLMAQSMVAAGTERAPLVEQLDTVFSQLVLAGETLIERGPINSAGYGAAEGDLFRTLKAIEDLNAHDFGQMQATAARATQLARWTIKLIAGALVMAVMLSFYLSWRLARSLLGPIQTLTSSASALGEGKLDTAVPVLSRDELGLLARVFNDMAAKLRAYRDAMREEVRRAQRTTEATLTATPDPVFVFSATGHIELRNPAATALALDGAEFPPPLMEAVQRVLASGQHELPMTYDRAVLLRVGREERHFLPRILAVSDPMTGLQGAAVILQDVTKFRLLDDAKNNLVGTVSHELKTPLTSLRMALYLLLEKPHLTPKQRDLLETARDDADRLLRILNDLLDLTRLEGGASQLNREPLQVATLLNEMAREIKPLTDQAQQRVVVHVSPEAGAVSVDAGRIRHVFINLLSNASKYSPPGGEITLYAEAAHDGFVRCGVHDQGPGIASEHLPHVFEKFYRVPGERKTGAGLGLAISREIVVAHGGTISCLSTPGQGSDFHLLLPVAP
ncbi:MAG TPA: ATP-binding protein [Opitutaceae bacterium]